MNAVKKYLVLTSVALMLTACGSQDIVTQTTVVEKQQLDPNLPPAMQLSDVNFGTIEDPVHTGQYLFTLDTDNYNNLSGNIVESQRYIRQLKQTVKFYKTHTPAPKK